MNKDPYREYYEDSSPDIHIANLYALINDPMKTLEFIELAYRDGEATVVTINKALDFRILKDHP